MKITYLFCASLVLCAAPAFCTVVTFANNTAWQNATTGDTTIGFEGLAPVNGQTNYSDTTGLVVGGAGGVDFVGWTGASSEDLHVRNPNPGAQYFDFGSGALLFWSADNGLPFKPYLQVTLPQNVTAVGLDVMTGAVGDIFHFGVNTPTFVYNSAATAGWPNQTFFGLTSDTPFNTFYVQLRGGDVPYIDNFSYGSMTAAEQDPPPADTPEAATFLMIAIGLIWMGKAHKRLRLAMAT